MTTGFDIASGVASLLGPFIAWYQSYVGNIQADKSATLQAYIEHLRREGHQQLADGLAQSKKHQQELLTILARLESEFEQTPSKLSDNVIQAMLDVSNFKVDAADAEFEADYLSHVSTRYRRLRTLGVREVKEVRQDLTVAYVTLNLSTSGRADKPLIKSAAEILAEHPLMTIRGGAGSGKTTLLQWLAVQCADGGPAPNPWYRCVPFFIPLRSLPESQKGKPLGEELVKCSVDPTIFTKSCPEGWIDRVLKSHRAVLLVDGVDEIPSAWRPDFWEWLSDWTDAHPSNHCYVTSRFFGEGSPQRTKGLWSPPSSFVDAEVKDMSDPDVKVFIEKWHQAVGDSETDPQEKQAVVEAGKKLPERLFDPANLRVRDLCRTPLLCALVCALHWREEGYLPSRRIDLYDRCCKMLIEERDRKRDIKPPTGPLGALTLPDKEMLLQRLAWSMMCNAGVRNAVDQRIEIDRDQAARWIKPNLKSCDNPECRGCDSEEVLAFLIERTGLVREPAKDRVDFSHRTFQEYLAACAAGYHDDVGSLAKRSMNDQWHETIILAAGTPVGGSGFGNRLVKALLERSEKLVQQRAKNLSLALALACIESGNQIKPNLAHQVLELVGRLVPPDSEVSAKHLAAARDAILPMLAYDKVEKAGWRKVSFCAYTIALIGTNAAVSMLRDPEGYGGDSRLHVINVICGCQQLNPLTVPSVRALLRKNEVPSGVSYALRRVNDLEPVAGDTEIQVLDLGKNRELTCFETLGTLTGLLSLDVSDTKFDNQGCQAVARLKALVYLNLARTAIDDTGACYMGSMAQLLILNLNSTHLTDRGAQCIAASNSVSRLNLDRTNLSDVGLLALSSLKSLRDLSIYGTKVTTEGIVKFGQSGSKVKKLFIGGRGISSADIQGLSGLAELEELTISTPHLDDDSISMVLTLGHLRALRFIVSSVAEGGFIRLRQGLPNAHISGEITSPTRADTPYRISRSVNIPEYIAEVQNLSDIP